MQITDEAKVFLTDMLKEHNAAGIKVYVTGGGCCGPAIGLALDAPEEGDIVEEINGIQTAFEKEAHDTASGITLDLNTTEEGKGLIIKGMDQCC